jgi:putative oxidoreductase
MSKFWEGVGRYGPLVGRILLAQIFIVSGWGKVTGFAGTAAYMAGTGMPLAEFFAVGAILLEFGGGIALILGWQARWAALAIFLFMIPATLIFHNFWAVDAAQVQDQMIHFMKNLCIIGGTLYVMAFGAGPLSMDNRRS